MSRAQAKDPAGAGTRLSAKRAPDVNSLREAPANEVLADNQWAMSLQKKKSALAETKDSSRNKEHLAYAPPAPVTSMSAAAPQQFGEQSDKRSAGLPQSAFDTAADANTQSSFAFGLMDSMSLANTRALGSARALATTADEGIDLQVRDTKRGFISGTRLAGQMQEQNGRRVLIIQAEDAESSPPELEEE